MERERERERELLLLLLFAFSSSSDFLSLPSFRVSISLSFRVSIYLCLLGFLSISVF